ncbi:hypothetical protein QNH14_20860 [Apirhabdus apintestini]|nr:hypothetical protein QNH14_20860 [Enterobacteriaceae bacterium CA-0114]
MGNVRATMPLNEPLRKLPNSVTTFKLSDMLTPYEGLSCRRVTARYGQMSPVIIPHAGAVGALMVGILLFGRQLIKVDKVSLYEYWE